MVPRSLWVQAQLLLAAQAVLEGFSLPMTGCHAKPKHRETVKTMAVSFVLPMFISAIDKGASLR